jgi:hypothetical protein
MCILFVILALTGSLAALAIWLLPGHTVLFLDLFLIFSALATMTYLVRMASQPRSNELAYPERNKVWEWKNYTGVPSYKAWVGNKPGGGVIGSPRPHL